MCHYCKRGSVLEKRRRKKGDVDRVNMIKENSILTLLNSTKTVQKEEGGVF
jgi:hypothetical protein